MLQPYVFAVAVVAAQEKSRSIAFCAFTGRGPITVARK
jgi:hypothetical protein